MRRPTHASMMLLLPMRQCPMHARGSASSSMPPPTHMAAATRILALLRHAPTPHPPLVACFVWFARLPSGPTWARARSSTCSPKWACQRRTSRSVSRRRPACPRCCVRRQQRGRHHCAASQSSTTSGLLLLPAPVCWSGGAPLPGWLAAAPLLRAVPGPGPGSGARGWGRQGRWVLLALPPYPPHPTPPSPAPPLPVSPNGLLCVWWWGGGTYPTTSGTHTRPYCAAPPPRPRPRFPPHCFSARLYRRRARSQRGQARTRPNPPPPAWPAASPLTSHGLRRW